MLRAPAGEGLNEGLQPFAFGELSDVEQATNTFGAVWRGHTRESGHISRVRKPEYRLVGNPKATHVPGPALTVGQYSVSHTEKPWPHGLSHPAAPLLGVLGEASPDYQPAPRVQATVGRGLERPEAHLRGDDQSRSKAPKKPNGVNRHMDVEWFSEACRVSPGPAKSEVALNLYLQSFPICGPRSE